MYYKNWDSAIIDFIITNQCFDLNSVGESNLLAPSYCFCNIHNTIEYISVTSYV